MTQLALLLTVVFIVYTLRRDALEGRQVSSASWLSFIWIILASSRSIIYWVYPSELIAFNQRIAWEQQSIDLIQNNPLERNVMLVLIALGLVVLINRRDRFQLRLEDNGWFVAFFFLCLFSIVWSGYPAITLKRWIRFAGDIIAVLLVLTERDPEEALDQIMRRLAIFLLPLSFLFIRYYDRLGRIYTTYGTQMWVGVTGHKNSLGMLCAYSGIFLAWRCLQKWPRVNPIDVALLALALYLLLGSRSQTSMIVFVLGLTLLFVQARMKGDIRKFNRAVVIVLVSVVVIQALAIVFLSRSLAPMFFTAAGRDSSFTGRVPLWQETLKMGFRTPLLGSGFSCFWLDNNRVMEIWRRVDWTPTTAHNGYIDIFMDLGIVGLLVLVFLLGQTYKNIIRSFKADPKFSKLKLVLFAMIIFHNFTETTFGKPNTLLWLLFLLASIVVRTGRGKESEGPPELPAGEGPPP